MSEIRVRFAPSPTGALHVGGARTALFNWLFARRHKGKFLLRVEDTDLQRSSEGAVQEILDGLSWLGLNWDEGPYFQSQRLSLYQEKAQKLIDQGVAYFSEEVRGEQPAIVFRIPKEKISFEDLLRGEVEFDNALQKDVVLMKSDGMPTYQFACVVDDALMGITHVIRGDDHLSNTPKQVALYHALGFALPQFVHVPMILGPDGARLSKRHGATSVEAYRQKGILPESLFNFLTLLGWSPGGDIEVLSREETIEKFSLERINKKSAIFDLKKLFWMNSVYLGKMSLERFVDQGWAFLKEQPQPLLAEATCRKALGLLHQRIQIWEELLTSFDYFFLKSYVIETEAVEKYLKTKEASSILTQIQQRLAKSSSFDEAPLEAEIRGLAESLGVKGGALIHPLRVAVTGKKVSPGIFETLAVLGKELTLERMGKTIEGLSVN